MDDFGLEPTVGAQKLSDFKEPRVSVITFVTLFAPKRSSGDMMCLPLPGQMFSVQSVHQYTHPSEGDLYKAVGA